MSRDFGTHTHGEDGIIIPTPLYGDSSGTSDLTEKQEKFCEEYLVDPNATQAAIRAGYSKKSA